MKPFAGKLTLRVWIWSQLQDSNGYLVFVLSLISCVLIKLGQNFCHRINKWTYLGRLRSDHFNGLKSFFGNALTLTVSAVFSRSTNDRYIKISWNSGLRSTLQLLKNRKLNPRISAALFVWPADNPTEILIFTHSWNANNCPQNDKHQDDSFKITAGYFWDRDFSCGSNSTA